ncbi:MAG: N-acetyltransferase [Methanomassiliicoccales archaeon]|nr:MAG: N-acetyltransferase [Methanomassiliicoccales archaeon]
MPRLSPKSDREVGVMEELKQHTLHLRGERIVLRPMTEGDWDILLKWNSDPEVLYFSEGTNVTSWDLDMVQQIYRSVSQSAFCFIVEFEDKPIGECWLEKMNLGRILRKQPGLDCRRIDLMIGEKALWGQGIGTEVVRLLVKFGFEEENADAIFACDVADYNFGSLMVFQKAGFEIFSAVGQPPATKAKVGYDLVLTREKYYDMASG